MNPEPAQRTKEPQLLPCPFCGGTHLEVIFYNTPCVVCHDCYANGAQAERLRADVDNRPEAARQARELWNRRAGIPDPAGAIEKARSALHFMVNVTIPAFIEEYELSEEEIEEDEPWILEARAALAALTAETQEKQS